jgi:hypothetical protein
MERTEIDSKQEAGRTPRKHTTKLEQIGHLAAWERSGLSAQAYGDLCGLAPASLYRWRFLERRRNRQRLEQVDEDTAGPESEQPAGFVSFDVEGASLRTRFAEVRVRMRGAELELEVSGVESQQALVALLLRLRKEVLDA